MKEEEVAHVVLELWRKKDGKITTIEDVDAENLSLEELCVVIAVLNRIKNEFIEGMGYFDDFIEGDTQS